MDALDRMDAGQWYDAGDPELERLRTEGNALAWQFNRLSPAELERGRELLTELFDEFGENAMVLAPVYVDYGSRIRIGRGTFVNHGAYLMDGGGITIGERCQIGPNLGAYTAAHPPIAEERATGMEKASPIVIEDDVWIGGDVTIMPGVTIGRGSVIGAGSVVTKDIPAGVIARGVPCRPARPITSGDSVANLFA